jgi:hypothetical protein
MSITTGISKQVGQVRESFDNITSIMDGLTRFGEAGSEISAGLIATARENFEGGMNQMLEFDFLKADGIANLRTQISNAQTVKTVAEELIDMLAGIATVVDGIPDITMNVEGMSEAASVIEHFNSVAGNAVAMTVTLNVAIDADQLAVAILNTDAAQALLTS